MTRIIAASIWVVLLAQADSSAAGHVRFAKRFQIPASAETVVVAEGEFEPRSIGSYALRVYGGASKKFPTDDFITGVIRPRNGVIEAVRFFSLDGDDSPEIVVILRAAGSGGYLSADSFRYRNRSLEFIAAVENLDKTADPIRALRDKIKTPGGREGAAK